MATLSGIDKLLQDLGDFAGKQAAQDLYAGLRKASERELADLKESFDILLRYEALVSNEKLTIAT